MFQNWSDCVSGGTTLSIIGKSLCSEDLKVPFVNYWILQHPPPFTKVHPSPAHPSVWFPLRTRYPSCLRPSFKGLKKQIHLGRAYYSRRFSRSRFYCKAIKGNFSLPRGLHWPSYEFHFEIQIAIFFDRFVRHLFLIIP